MSFVKHGFKSTEQLEHFRKHMEAGEPSISTNMSEDENEEETSTGEEEPLNGTYCDPFL